MKKYCIFVVNEKFPIDSEIISAPVFGQALGYYKKNHLNNGHLRLVAKEERLCPNCGTVHNIYLYSCPNCDEPYHDD